MRLSTAKQWPARAACACLGGAHSLAPALAPPQCNPGSHRRPRTLRWLGVDARTTPSLLTTVARTHPALSRYAQAASYAFQQQYGSTAGVPAAYGASSNALMPAPVASAYGAPAYGTAMHAAYGQAAVAPPAAPAAAETAAAAPLEPSVATPFDPDAKFDIAAANAVFMRSKQLVRCLALRLSPFCVATQ